MLKPEGKRQKAKIKRQKEGGLRRSGKMAFFRIPLLPFAFCPLPFALHFSSHHR
jgi:hypothetical protein